MEKFKTLSYEEKEFESFCVANGLPKEPFKKVYERQIPFDDSLTFPYSSLYSSMRFLYGDDCMFHFIVY